MKKKSGENLKAEEAIEIKRETCVNMDADINNYISYFQFFSSENLIIPKWLAQNTSFPRTYPNSQPSQNTHKKYTKRESSSSSSLNNNNK